MRAMDGVLVSAVGLILSAAPFFAGSASENQKDGSASSLLDLAIQGQAGGDDHTQPLKAEETKQANGTVQIGESEDAPKFDLAPGKKKETLEAALANGVKFPYRFQNLSGETIP